MAHGSIDGVRRQGSVGHVGSPLVGGVVRLLALADALAVPGLGLAWVWTWPDHHGALVGAVVSAVLLYFAIKRACRALFAIESYRWGFTRFLLVLLAVAFLMKLTMWGQRFF